MRDYLAIFNKFVQMYGRLPTEVDPDYLELLRMSKYRILDVPDINMAKCANCGSVKNDGRKYCDFGLQVEWYGVVYLCGFCIKDIANEMGLFQSYIDEIAKLTHKLLNIKVEAVRGDQLHLDLIHIFEEVKEYLDTHVSTASDNSTSSDSPDVGSNEGPSKSKSESTRTEPRATKSNSSKGSTNLRSLAELLDAESK